MKLREAPAQCELFIYIFNINLNFNYHFDVIVLKKTSGKHKRVFNSW